MEAYYDSDEEVYWGPVTLKEKKKDLFRPVSAKSIKQRRTVGCNPTFDAESIKRAETLIQMDEATPSKARRSSYPKDQPEPGFIEKLVEVLDVTADTSTYHTAVDSIKSSGTNVTPSDTLDDIKNATDIFESATSSALLDNVQCTLYDSIQLNTLPVVSQTSNQTPEIYTTANYFETNEIISVSDSDQEEDRTSDNKSEIFTLQHSLSDDIHNEEIPVRRCVEEVDNKKESFLSSCRRVKEDVMCDMSSNDLEVDHLVSLSDESNRECDAQSDKLPEAEISRLPQKRENRSTVSDADQLISEDSLQDLSVSTNPSDYHSDTSDNRNISRPPDIYIYDTEGDRLANVMGNLDIIEEVEEYDSTKKFEILSSSKTVKNTFLEKDSSECSEASAFQFNDTLEEMDRLLNQGLNYTMEEQKHVLNNGEIKPKKKEMVTPVRTIPPPVKSAKKPTPFKSSFSTPSTLPKVTRNKFKNIQSPVATYIRNAGTTPLIQKVTPSKEMNRIPVSISKKNQENTNPQTSMFPQLRYKPAKQRLVNNEEFKLPSSIDSLIPIKATVTKHEKRIGGAPKAGELSDGDLTMAADSAINTTTDISILVTKKAFIS